MVLYFAENAKMEHANFWSIVLERISGAMIAFFMIALSIREERWLLSKFLIFQPIFYLGQISYGLYLYHNLVMNYYHDTNNTIWYYLSQYLPDYQFEIVNFTWMKFLVSFIILVVIASFSWFVIEKPINKYKNRI